MTHEYILWYALAAYAVHVLEETSLNWKAWAKIALKLKNVEWAIFDIANAAVMFIAIAAAMVGWKSPAFALVIPALMLINGLFFHIFPT
ncbi:MAG: HXXEE domain-containing protein [Gammaproteobacteria bacterium]|nr:HXXEE domain-containing protein [Gammaproteobacteria bacterium]